MNRTEIERVAEAALPHLPRLVEAWFPAGTWRGHEYVVGDLQGNPGDSLSINVQTGAWCDFAAPDQRGGDPVSLLAAMRGYEGEHPQLEAARELAAEIGFDTGERPATGPPAAKGEKGGQGPATPMTPVPADAPAPPDVFNRKEKDDSWTRLEVSQRWEYRDAEGRLLGCVCRFDLPDGSKEVIPQTYCEHEDGVRRWRWLSFAKPRPLYGLDRLAARTGANVIVVEGEKAADAGQRLLAGRGVVVLSWPGGGKAVRHADWSALAGRKVVLWPDADEAGRDTVEGYLDAAGRTRKGIAQLVEPHAAGVRVVDPPPDVEEGWDLADAERDGWTADDVLGWIRQHVRPAQPRDPNAGVDDEPPPPEPLDEPPPPEPLDEPLEEPPPEISEGEPDPFVTLGYDHSAYYYLPRRTQQITRLPTSAHTKVNLLELAPLWWWSRQFPGKNGINWMGAADTLIQMNSRRVFDPSRIRGAGAWYDEGRAVLHLGDHLLVDGVHTRMPDISSRHIYEAGPAIEGDPVEQLSASDANGLVELCEMLEWSRPIDGRLLAGWCVVAPICGALQWRPHVWITGQSGSGKAQPHSAGVLTPDGWTVMGALSEGDYVTTPDNHFARVLRVYPQGKQQIYRLTFADGRQTRATGDHLWKVRVGGDWRLRTTEEMLSIMEQPSCSLAVPITEPIDVKRNRKDTLPMHPYVLGVLLGDGYLGSEGTGGARECNLTTKDPEIIERIEKCAPEMVSMGHVRNITWRFKSLSDYGKTVRECIKDLRLLGSRSHDKFIPEVYKRASIEDRWELLRGLLDTDGTAGRSGTISFCTVSPYLAEDVAYVIRSLGGTAYTTTRSPTYTHNGERREGRTAYVINIRFRDRSMAFHLKRKMDRCCGDYQYQESFYLPVASIEEDGYEEASCIEIDHPERLYLTDDFVVTHNTWVAENVVKPCLGPTALPVQGHTTEAGIRQALRQDARPILFDEAEAEDRSGRYRIQSILDLARQASSEANGAILKGTTGGQSMVFRVRSAFCLVSVGVSLQQQADQSRWTKMVLRKNIKPTSAQDFARIEETAATLLTPAYCASLRARAYRLIPVIRDNARVFAAEAAAHLGSQRLGDQMGALLAGAYALFSAKRISREAAREWIQRQDWEQQDAEAWASDEDRLIAEIVQTPLRVELERGSTTRSIAELIQTALQGGDIEVDSRLADRVLARHGLRATERHGEDQVLFSCSHRELRRLLAETPWSLSWADILRRAPGAEDVTCVRFGAKSTRAVAVPARTVLGEEEEGEQMPLSASQPAPSPWGPRDEGETPF